MKHRTIVITVRVCNVCKKFNRPLSECPHPGRTITHDTGLTDRPITFRAGFSVSASVEPPRKLLEPSRKRLVLIGDHVKSKWIVDEDNRLIEHVPMTDDEEAFVRPATWQERNDKALWADAAERGEVSLRLLESI